MTEVNSKIGFWQLPISLKLIVAWLGGLSLIYILGFISGISKFFKNLFLDTDHYLNIGSLVSAIILLALANGLINQQNSARIWTSIFAGVSLLALVSFLFWILFILPPGASFWYEVFANRTAMSQTQMIGVSIVLIVIDVIILYVLLRSNTKSLFQSRPNST